MADPIDATLPRDRDLASTWPALLRETRSLLNALIGGTVIFTDPTSGKHSSMQASITGQDANGADIWGITFTEVS
jgi:hypothetical protein